MNLTLSEFKGQSFPATVEPRIMVFWTDVCFSLNQVNINNISDDIILFLTFSGIYIQFNQSYELGKCCILLLPIMKRH